MRPSQIRAIREGRCLRCGETNAQAPKRLCLKCTGKAYTPARAIIQRRRWAVKRQVWKRTGLCGRCGRAPVARLRWCVDCRQDHNARRAA